MDVRRFVPKLTCQYHLRGADTIHLASAAYLQEAGLQLTFVVADIKLLNAARDYGIRTVNPTE
jgi:hypothetical protein